MGIIKAIMTKVNAFFAKAVECRHGDIQCAQCAQDWFADGEGIGPVTPRHDRPQRGVIPNPGVKD